MRQSKADAVDFMCHSLRLRNTLRTDSDAPCRGAEALRHCSRRTTQPVASAPVEDVQAALPPAAPLFVMTAPSAQPRSTRMQLKIK